MASYCPQEEKPQEEKPQEEEPQEQEPQGTKKNQIFKSCQFFSLDVVFDRANLLPRSLGSLCCCCCSCSSGQL